MTCPYPPPQRSRRLAHQGTLHDMTKFVFVTGGVVSSLGKGIASASLAAILESRGLKVTLIKLDPYINVEDRKSTRLNSSHSQISYAVFCLKKKKKNTDSVTSARKTGTVTATLKGAR